MPSDGQDLFSWASLATLGGGAAATFIVSNALQKAFDFNPKWLALVIAEGIAVVVALSAELSVERLVVGVINGFVIYAAASGGTSIGNAVTGEAPAPPAPIEAAAARAIPKAGKPPRRFFASWWVGPAANRRLAASRRRSTSILGATRQAARGWSADAGVYVPLFDFN